MWTGVSKRTPDGSPDGEEHQEEEEEEPSPSELFQRLKAGLSKLSVCSRVIPSREDFHYYRNFDEFKSPIEEITARSHSMLDSIASSAAAAAAPPPTDDDEDGAYDWLVDVNNKALERLDMSLDEFKRLRSEQEEGGEFQLVCGKKKKKKKKKKKETTASAASSSSSGLVKTTKSKVSFHVPSIRKPQEEFKILMNNSNQPFQHVWLETTW